MLNKPGFLPSKTQQFVRISSLVILHFLLVSCKTPQHKEEPQKPNPVSAGLRGELSAYELIKTLYHVGNDYYEEIDINIAITTASRSILSISESDDSIEIEQLNQLITNGSAIVDRQNPFVALLDSRVNQLAQERELDTVEIFGNAINAVIETLDKRSEYITYNELQANEVSEPDKPDLEHTLFKNLNYVKIYSLGLNTNRNFVNAVKDMDKRSNSKDNTIILDLRDCPGGILKTATDFVNEFVTQGTIAVVKGRKHIKDYTFSAYSDGAFTNRSAIILINEKTASGAEVIAGALQRQKKAVIVGTKSRAIGSVHSLIPITSSSALKLKTGEIYLGDHYPIANNGIIPDYTVPEEHDTDTLEQIHKLLTDLNLIQTEI